MAPGSTEFEFATLSEGGTIFDPELRRLQTLYPEAYAQGYKSTFVPLGPEYVLEWLP